MISRLLPALLIFFISQTIQADESEPWFTGPLFALSGQTVPRGHVAVFLSGNTATIDSLYDRLWDKVPTDKAKSVEFNPQFLYGLTDNLDLQYTMSYVQNQNRGSTYGHIGDTLVMLGYQAFTQDGKRPYLRITIQQIIPTGLYNNLSESRNGTNITGMGSNQTSFGLDFEYLSQLSATHYLNSTLNISYTHAMDVSVQGLNAYGGTSSTHGHLDPGDSVAIDLATEMSITQQWVAVLEGIFIYQQAASFKGVIGTPTEDDPQPLGSRSNRSRHRLNHRLIPSKNNIGGINAIGSGNLDEITLAPAIEYNFSDQYGVIAGVWFTVAGKNIPAFVAPMVTFNAYW